MDQLDDEEIRGIILEILDESDDWMDDKHIEVALSEENIQVSNPTVWVLTQQLQMHRYVDMEVVDGQAGKSFLAKITEKGKVALDEIDEADEDDED